MARRKPVSRECECQHDAHFMPGLRKSRMPEHGYRAMCEHVVAPPGPFTLARCYFCRVHHVHKLGRATEGA